LRTTPRDESYPLCRPENLELLNRVIRTDEFDDDAKGSFTGCHYSEGYLDFIRRNLHKNGDHLDLGCGSGTLLRHIDTVTAMGDGNPHRVHKAKALAEELGLSVDVRLCASECLPWDPLSFGTITYLHGFFQVRSDYEVLMEVNRALWVGGHFIFDLPAFWRAEDLEFGRVIDPKSYVTNILKDFGFRLVEQRLIDDWDEAICVEKVRAFDWERMKKLQLIEVTEGPCLGLFDVRNLRKNDYTLRLPMTIHVWGAPENDKTLVPGEYLCSTSTPAPPDDAEVVYHCEARYQANTPVCIVCGTVGPRTGPERIH